MYNAYRKNDLPAMVTLLEKPMHHSSACLQGTSTVCILALEDNKLHAANLGDSGFLVVRKQKVVFRCPSQQHRFNFPYQLGCPGTQSDLPEHAEASSMTTCNMLQQVAVYVQHQVELAITAGFWLWHLSIMLLYSLSTSRLTTC